MTTLKDNPARRGDILIVDDTVANLKLLANILAEAGYSVRPASDGELALRSVQARQPALILLDIRMPGMDGFEVCRRLRADEATRDIPVIFLSSLTETTDKAKGFELGAVDFIPKPYHAQEVLARIKTHLALSTAREQLKTRNTELHGANEQLTREIVERRRAEAALAAALKRMQALSERLTRAQEEERSRIAFELHEQSGQELTTLMLHLQMLEPQCRSKDAKGRLRDARTIAELALERVRSMTLDLHPPQLDNFGLYPALRAHCRQQAEAAGWTVHIDTPQTRERPHPEVELACFRVAQEALTNVAQHAKATEVWLSLSGNDDALHLSVRDNGVGFDPTDVRDRLESGNLGLIAIEERLRQMRGRLEIKSSRGNGTEIHAVFPRYASSK